MSRKQKFDLTWTIDLLPCGEELKKFKTLVPNQWIGKGPRKCTKIGSNKEEYAFVLEFENKKVNVSSPEYRLHQLMIRPIDGKLAVLPVPKSVHMQLFDYPLREGIEKFIEDPLWLFISEDRQQILATSEETNRALYFCVFQNKFQLFALTKGASFIINRSLPIFDVHPRLQQVLSKLDESNKAKMVWGIFEGVYFHPSIEHFIIESSRVPVEQIASAEACGYSAQHLHIEGNSVKLTHHREVSLLTLGVLMHGLESFRGKEFLLLPCFNSALLCLGMNVTGLWNGQKPYHLRQLLDNPSMRVFFLERKQIIELSACIPARSTLKRKRWVENPVACVSCGQDKASMAANVCGHLCCCSYCAEQLLLQQTKRCPVCFTQVESFKTILFPIE